MTLMILLCSLAFADPPAPPPVPVPPGATESQVREREARILEVIQAEAPERHAELLTLKQTDPQAYWRAMKRLNKVYVRHGDDPETLQRQIRIRDLDLRLRELARGFDTLPADEQKQRRGEMEEVAAELFELKQAHRRARLAELEARMDELEAEIDDRESRKEAIIDDFLEHLIEGRPEL